MGFPSGSFTPSPRRKKSSGRHCWKRRTRRPRGLTSCSTTGWLSMAASSWLAVRCHYQKLLNIWYFIFVYKKYIFRIFKVTFSMLIDSNNRCTEQVCLRECETSTRCSRRTRDTPTASSSTCCAPRNSATSSSSQCPRRRRATIRIGIKEDLFRCISRSGVGNWVLKKRWTMDQNPYAQPCGATWQN